MLHCRPLLGAGVDIYREYSVVPMRTGKPICAPLQAFLDCWRGLEWTSRGGVKFKTSIRTGNPICALLQATVGVWSGHLEGVFSLRRYLCAREIPYVLYCRPLLGAGVDI